MQAPRNYAKMRDGDDFMKRIISVFPAPSQANEWRREWRLMMERVVEAWRDWSRPERNPFLQRALREGERARQLPRLTMATLLMMLSFVVIGWMLWLEVKDTLDLGRDYPMIWDVPPMLGGNAPAFTALLALAACVLCVLFKVTFRFSPLRREVLQNTLPNLQLLPIGEERWLWLMTAHPAFLAFRIWLCGLPVFVLAVLFGGWSAFDVLGLLLLFLALGCGVPRYAPQVWESEATRTGSAPHQSRSGSHGATAPGDGTSQSNESKSGVKADAHLAALRRPGAEPHVGTWAIWSAFWSCWQLSASWE